MALPNWSPFSPDWTNETWHLLNAGKIEKPFLINLKDFIDSSNKFPIKFPVETGRCETLKQYVSKDVLERNINSAYPIVHESALKLYCDFILHKRQHGSRIEKEFYKNMSLKDFINRLLNQRAVMFVDLADQYLLLNGSKGSKNWESMGTNNEKPPLVLKDCLSYDEIKCSVFLSVSSYTYFINLGDRFNMAKYRENRNNVAEEGVIIGMIGARLEKPNVMEFQEIIATEKQNIEKNGYGSSNNSIHGLFSKFYKEKCLTFKETQFEMQKPENSTRYINMQSSGIFDNVLYYKRLAVSFDTLLMEADFRAKQKGTTAYIHVVGLGLGVWRFSSHQEKVYMDSFAKQLKTLGSKLDNVSDICFSYINEKSCGPASHGEIFKIKNHPLTGIKIHIFKREPHEKLKNEHEGKLLIISYAWDGNAFPGNEYWSGVLDSSGDPAAASSTQIAEIHNPYINDKRVSADNLMVVCEEGVVSLEQYREVVRRAVSKRPLEESN